MKSNVKKRQQDQRDHAAFLVLLWFVLNTLHFEPWNWAEKRLQRVFDAALKRMYDNKDDEWIGWILEDWAIKMGLTEEDFIKRELEREAKKNG